MIEPGRRPVAGGVWSATSAPFPEDSAPLYTVGQVAEMLGVQAAFLRRLDTLNVICPSRSPGGQRRYSRLEIEDIHAITELLGEGFTPAGARRIIELQAEVAELRRRLGEPTRQE